MFKIFNLIRWLQNVQNKLQFYKWNHDTKTQNVFHKIEKQSHTIIHLFTRIYQLLNTKLPL